MTAYKIGRSSGNDIVIEDTSVSRNHADIEDLGAGKYRLRDHGSTGGTQVDSGAGWIAIEDTIVKPGDNLRFGDVEISVSELATALSDHAEAEADPDIPRANPPAQPSGPEPEAKMSEQLSWQEEHVIDVFYVTGFFGGKAKPGVGRGYAMVVRQIKSNSKVPGMRMNDIALGLTGLEHRGLLAIDRGKSVATLTDRGFAVVSAPDFKTRVRAPAPDEATRPAQPSAGDAQDAALFAVAMGTSLGDDGGGE